MPTKIYYVFYAKTYLFWMSWPSLGRRKHFWLYGMQREKTSHATSRQF